MVGDKIIWFKNNFFGSKFTLLKEVPLNFKQKYKFKHISTLLHVYM